MARRKGALGVWQAWRGEFYATVSFSPQDFSVEESQVSGTRRSRELETWLNEVAPQKYRGTIGEAVPAAPGM